MEHINIFIENYGYLAVLVGSAIDHTGTPAALIIAVGFVIAGNLKLIPVLLFVFLGALIADLILFLIGYFIGRSAILKLFNKYKLSKNIIERTEDFFVKNGTSLIIWGRFIAIVSRYIPIVCGFVKLNFTKFICYSILGNAIMTLSYGLIAYFLGSQVNKYFEAPLFIVYLSITIIIAQLIYSIVIYQLNAKNKN